VDLAAESRWRTRSGKKAMKSLVKKRKNSEVDRGNSEAKRLAKNVKSGGLESINKGRARQNKKLAKV
jgi:predicted RNA-binding protein with PUA domain